MKLHAARVQLFRNIVDSGKVEITHTVTALVGKNESGKSAFLDALYRLNPAYPERFSVRDDYPRWRLRRDQSSQGDELSETRPITAWFELDADDALAVQKKLGFEFPVPKELQLFRRYDGTLTYRIDVDEKDLVAAILKDSGQGAASLGRPVDLDGLKNAVAEKAVSGGSEEQEQEDDFAVVRERLDSVGTNGSSGAWEVLKQRIPTFWRFNRWSELPARIDLQKLVDADLEELPPGQRTALSLIGMSGGTPAEFLEDDYETRVAELEASANEISEQVFEFWSQNDTLEVSFDTEPQTVEDNRGKRSVLKHLQVRIRDRRHKMTTSFGARSTGFQWFFSFLAAFYEYQNRNDIVVLLDEPGLGLHGRAQKDFLRFITEKLAATHQVVYTTHSPYMIETGRLERVRLVEDHADLDIASTITSDIRVRDPDTLFPLQAALGYDISHALFATGHNLIAEGVSDFIYLETLSSFLASEGRTGLNEKWNVVPVGGASKVPTFVALLGTHLDLTVLVDSTPGKSSRIADLASDGILDSTRILSIEGQLGRRHVDLEDLFTEGEYLKLYNAALSDNLKVKDLQGGDGVVRRIERQRGSTFGHADPAMELLRQGEAFLQTLSQGTLDRFESLFASINNTSP